MKIVTNNAQETKKIGEDLAQKIDSGITILLYGDLGAGKTTFVQGFAKGLGIKDRILSPTFVLQRIHDIEKGKIRKLNHLDLYRIENPTEIKNLGIEEIFEDSESINLIEWADRLLNFNPKKGYRIYIKTLNDSERVIEIKQI